MTGRAIITVARILARQNGASEFDWKHWSREAVEIIEALQPGSKIIAGLQDAIAHARGDPAAVIVHVPHQGVCNDRDRKMGAGG